MGDSGFYKKPIMMIRLSAAPRTLISLNCRFLGFRFAAPQALRFRLLRRLFPPDDGVAPKKVFLDARAGKDVGAEFADLAHGWVKVVVLVCGPGVASFT